MKHCKKSKSTALIFAVILVSVVSFVVATTSRNALQTLMSGTNITDWEIASQAAETGLENCVTHLLPMSQADLLNGSGVWPAGATLDSDIFGRRDMDNLPLPVQDISLTTPPGNPTHQYWNCKIWQQTAGQTPVGNPSQYWKMTPQFDRIDIPGNLYGGHDADILAWALIGDVDQQQGKYSVRISFKPELPVAGDYDTTLTYWVWADTIQTPTIDPTSHCPKIGGTCMPSRTFPHSIADDPGDFFDHDVALDELIDVSDPTTGIQNKYLHFYYTMNIAGYTGTTLKKLTFSANFAKPGWTFKDDWYYIDAVGMYGITRSKIRAAFDPYSKHFWRMPFE